jgi:hypothetical protein
MIGGCLTVGLPQLQDRTARWQSITHLSWQSPLVMLIWGVASDALREIITGFLDEVRFD